MSLPRVVGGQLTVQANDRATDQRHAVFHAGLVQHMTGLEIVAAVQHHLGCGQELVQQSRVGFLLQGGDADIRVERQHRLLGGSHFGLTYALGTVGNLSLQVGEVHLVMVDQGDVPHTAGR